MRTSSAAIIAGTLLLAAVAPAPAADEPLPAGSPVLMYSPRPAYSWDGFYVGGNVGGIRNQHEFDPIAGVPLFPPFLQSLQPFVIIEARNATLPGATTEAQSFTGGGQLGVNWQINQVVVGVETDFNAMRLTNTAVASVSEIHGGVFTARYEATTNWVGTTRVRLGFAWDNLLVYGTAGMAYSPTRLVTNLLRDEPRPSVINLDGPVGGSDSSGVQVGWVAGIGGEWGLTPSLSVGIEYRHVDLGIQAHDVGRTLPTSDGVILATTVKTTLDQATLRVNWRWYR
jgi:outer membrane immunogenic protein